MDVECGVVGSSMEGREYGRFCKDDILVKERWELSVSEGDASNDVSVHFPLVGIRIRLLTLSITDLSPEPCTSQLESLLHIQGGSEKKNEKQTFIFIVREKRSRLRDGQSARPAIRPIRSLYSLEVVVANSYQSDENISVRTENSLGRTPLSYKALMSE